MHFVLSIIFLSAALGLFIALISFFITLVRAERSGAPFFPTPKNAIEEALRAAEIEPGEKFYDIGAGTGRALIIAEKKFHADAAGAELSTLFYLIARLNLWFRHAHARILLADFYMQELADVDVLFCFLVPRGIEKLEAKLKKELHPGARVISYIFPLPFWKSLRVVELPNKKKIFIYKVDRVEGGSL